MKEIVSPVGAVRVTRINRSGRFLALSKHELGFDPLDLNRLFYYFVGFGYWTWIALLAVNALGSRQQGSSNEFAWSASMSGFWLFFVAGVPILGSATLALLSAYLFRPTEFQFTCAINRQIQCRIQFAVAGLMIFLPLMAGLGWQCLKPDLIIDSRTIDPARFLAVFPGGHFQTGDATNLILPRGKIVVAASQLWLAGVAFMLAEAIFYAGVSRHNMRLEYWLRLVLGLPAVLMVTLAVIQAYSANNFYHVFLLFFASHEFLLLLALPIAMLLVQQFCERRFCRWEIA